MRAGFQFPKRRYTTSIYGKSRGLPLRHIARQELDVRLFGDNSTYGTEPVEFASQL